MKLEQVIYIHELGSIIPTYFNLKRENHEFNIVDSVDKEECRRFEFLLNDLEPRELRIAHLMLKTQGMLGNHIKNTRGAGLQGALSGIGDSRVVIGGSNVQKYHLRGDRGYTSIAAVAENALANPGSLLVQNIVAHIVNPVPHIKITAHLLQEDEVNLLILDTVNQIEITDNDLSPHFVLALLNSRLVNWFVYRFIYAKAIRTMHFDNPVTNRIPLADYSKKLELVEKIESEVKNIYANRHANEKSSQERIDKYIYELYGLSADQIALVEANMP